jgi:SWI/SNF-related matrix-associated actin-dependent regulator of chromatin subfamily A3
MGLGKTLQTIALIVADVATEKKLVPVPKVDGLTCTGGTLIIAPVSVMSNWSGQIEQHVSLDHPLKVLRYHGSGKQAKLADYDVVVTSYGTLSSDYGARRKGLFGLKWRRVVLDEAHLIRNPKSKASLAANNLDAASRWALSGTPIVNNLKDLYSLIRFLRYSGGLAEFDIFNRTLIRPLNRGEPGASQLLQILMATVCLRRVKDMKFVDLRLPEMTEFLHKVEFWKEEKEKYDILEMEAKGLLAKYQKGKNTNGADEYRFLLEILLRMRQMCNHQSLCGDRIESLMKLAHTDKVDLTDENTYALQDLLQLAIDAQEECSICLDFLHNPRITICKHVFDHACIEKAIELQHKCPMCRCPLPELTTSTVSPPLPTLQPSETPAGSSSKVEAITTILLATRQKSPGTKTVVFSQWTSFLTLLEPFLAEKEIAFARIDGTMKPPKRDENILRFSTDDTCEVLLASLAVANVGLNLVMANQVVLADSWWAPAVEDQAVPSPSPNSGKH